MFEISEQNNWDFGEGTEDGSERTQGRFLGQIILWMDAFNLKSYFLALAATRREETEILLSWWSTEIEKYQQLQIV